MKGAISKGAATFPVPRSAGALVYKYFHLIFGIRKAVCALNMVKWADTASGSHVAYWLGVNNGDITEWLQGGVEQESFESKPNAYIEIQGTKYQLLTWPVELHTKVTVRLTKPAPHTWHIRVSWVDAQGATQVREQTTTVHMTNDDAMLEIFGEAAAGGTINGKTIYGNTLPR